MKRMKQTISFLLAVAIVAAFIPAAFADDDKSSDYSAAVAALTGDGTAADVTAAVSTYEDAQAHFGIDDAAAVDALASTCDTSGTKLIEIDFESETIYWAAAGTAPAVEPAFVSFDGGQKWSAMKFSIGTAAEPADFSKFLNKESTIWITTALDPKTKKPQTAVAQKMGTGDDKDTVIQEAIDAAITWKFGKINARPKLDKFSLDYATYAVLGANGEWTLKKGGSQTIDKLQVAYSTDKKNPVPDKDENIKYGVFPTGAGLSVVEGSKPGEKLTFLVRVAPTTKSAGSKPKKYSVSTLTKAPNLKVDYKKNIIAAKAGTIVGDATATQTTSDDPWVFEEFTANGTAGPGKGKLNGTDITFKAYTKESNDVKPGIKITLPEAGATAKHFGVQVAATEKKPASLIQLITVAPASEIYEVDASLTIKGTSVKLPKGYEACAWGDRTKTDTKWKASLKVEKNGLYAVRLKNTAKYNAKTNATTGNTTSGNLILGVVVGKDAKGKAIVAGATYLADDGSTDNSGGAFETASAAKNDSIYLADYTDAVVNLKVAKTDATLTKEVTIVEGSGLTITEGVLKTADKLSAPYATGETKFTVTIAGTAEENIAAAVLEYDTSKITVGYDAEKTYLPTVTVNVVVDNKSFVSAVKTALTAAALAPAAAASYADQAAAEAAVKAKGDEVKDEVKDDCTLAYEFSDYVAIDAGAGSIKVKITITRGDNTQETSVITVVLAKDSG